MSDAPQPPAPPRNSPLDPPGGRKLDPAAVAIGVGGAVLLLAVWWLLSTPRLSADATVAQEQFEALRQETGALSAKLDQLPALSERLKAIEARPLPTPPDLRPLEAQIAALSERAATAERAAAQQAERVAAQVGERVATAERRLQAIEVRPAFDPAAVAPRAAFETLGGVVTRAGQQIEALGTRVQAVDAEALKRLEEYGRTDAQRAAQAEQAAAQKVAALDASLKQALAALEAAQQQKIAAQEQAIGQRTSALETTLGQRIAATESSLGQKLSATETAVGQRIASVEQAQQKMVTLEARTARLGAIDRLRGALAAGQPLGESLARIDQPPAALARFATVAPPTESGLRLAFEDAARAARAASDAALQPDGGKGGVVDSALQRLGGLVTIRRGEQVVWGDAAEAEIERARRALEAGDIELSLTFLGKLPPPARTAMQPWADQARALVAARAALRQLAAG